TPRPPGADGGDQESVHARYRRSSRAAGEPDSRSRSESLGDRCDPDRELRNPRGRHAAASAAGGKRSLRIAPGAAREGDPRARRAGRSHHAPRAAALLSRLDSAVAVARGADRRVGVAVRLPARRARRSAADGRAVARSDRPGTLRAYGTGDMIEHLATQIAAAITMRTLYPANHPRVIQTVE